MKKSFVLFFIILCLFMGAGCGTQTVDPVEEGEKKEASFPATYTIPDGWSKSDEYSTEEKFFYIEDGKDVSTSTPPDNISINIGKNRYSAEEHPVFRDAILKQILKQVDDTKATLNGSGTFTKQGYPVYIFTITEDDTGTITQQYYIVDDYRYCLIHLTNYTDSKSAAEAAKLMADSFIWTDSDETKSEKS